VIASFLLALLLVLFAVVLSAVVVLVSLRVDACAGRSCDLVAGQFSVYLTPAVGLVGIVLAIVLSVVRGFGGRSLWPAPVLGIVLVIIGFVVALIINTVALTPS
jgi:hypothetical protein